MTAKGDYSAAFGKSSNKFIQYSNIFEEYFDKEERNGETYYK
jgi:hypothetical protein